MLKAVIFDFDGVVADSERLHYKALNQVFAAKGIQVPEEVHWQKYLGYTDLENVLAVNDDYKMNWSSQEIQQIIELKTAQFHALARTEAPIIDGVEEFVEMLSDHGYPLAICSGAMREDIRIMLEHSGFAHAFSVMVTAEDVEKGKPDPQGYTLALKKLNDSVDRKIESGNCIVIEDSRWGLQAAAAAGMRRIGVTNTYPKEHLAQFADFVIDRLDKLAIPDLKKICNSNES
ncbi:MAG: HAD family phosphatase [Sedimentisphaerales bacterium]|nr:HAD family phosphatase [Sedimentisphaerales bacterium]